MVPLLLVLSMVPLLQAFAALAAMSSAGSLSGFMWKRASTALTRKLQMKPITSSPAMMYIVVL